jgi:superfamily I DNA/RNA helicase
MGVFQALEDSDENLVVSATAGSGKSTLLKGIIGLLPTNAKINVMMFNVSVKDAFEKDPRIPKRVTVSTAHGCGYGLLIGYFRGDAPQVDDNKANKLAEWGLKRLRELMSDKSRYHPVPLPKLPEDRELAEIYLEKWRDALKQLIDMARLNLANNDVESLEWVANYFAIRFPFGKRGIAWGIRMAIDLLEDCFRIGAYDRQIDYVDMVWLPYKLKLYPRKPKATRAYALFDECQDSPRSFINLYKKFEIVGYRCIFVGDPFQSISGYTGALPTAMDTIIKLFNAKVLPLSESQRCPKSHVALASLISPQMKARADAIEGTCELMYPDNVKESVQPGDLVLCRFVAPLIKLFLEAKFFNGRHGVVRARDIAKEMSGFAKQVGKNCKWSNFHTKLLEQKEYLVERYKTAGQLTQADATADRYQCLEYCYEFLGANAGSLKEFVEKIDEVFPVEPEDRSKHVIYSSIHSAKGDESQRVYVVGINLLPYYRMGMLNWQFEQEIFATFVAITRSKSAMYYVPLEKDASKLEELMQTPAGGLKMEYFPHYKGEPSES